MPTDGPRPMRVLGEPGPGKGPVLFRAMTADEWFEAYWCGCGCGEPAAVLRDYFAAFRDDGKGEYPRFYLDLDLGESFARKYGMSVFCLLGYLLGGAGLIEHSGSVVSGAWLTPLGEEIRERAIAGELGGEE